jgi:hypothetical protein
MANKASMRAAGSRVSADNIIRHFVSSPRDQNKKKANYFMATSSGFVPSNPNTLRDSGPARNAIYTITDLTDEEPTPERAHKIKASRLTSQRKSRTPSHVGQRSKPWDN